MKRLLWPLAAAMVVGAIVATSLPAGARIRSGSTPRYGGSLIHSGPGTAAKAAWVATWGASDMPAGVNSFNSGTGINSFKNATLRLIIHVSLGGAAVRVHLANTFGTRSVTFGRVFVGLQKKGAAVVPGSNHLVTFGGARSVTVPKRGDVVSDSVALRVPALANLAVSLYMPKETGPPTGHGAFGQAFQTSYLTAGDWASDSGSHFSATTPVWFWLDAVDVVHPRARTIVALGDSITDGFTSTPDLNHRYPDFLAARLVHKGLGLAVVNEGIGGNKILATDSCCGDNASALARLNRDALGKSGEADVIFLEGINDIGDSNVYDSNLLIAGMRKIIARVHAKGLKIFGGTLLPFQGSFYYSSQGDQTRQAVNTWIMTSKAFDGVIDFDRALRNPKHPLQLLPKYDSGDHLHPSDLGYKAMANAVNLGRFP